MKVYELSKRRIWVKEIESGFEFFFDHIDGMYSYCIDRAGNIIHPVAWTEVEVIENVS